MDITNNSDAYSDVLDTGVRQPTQPVSSVPTFGATEQVAPRKSKSLTINEVKEIISKKPDNMSNSDVLNGLRQRGYELEGYNEIADTYQRQQTVLPKIEAKQGFLSSLGQTAQNIAGGAVSGLMKGGAGLGKVGLDVIGGGIGLINKEAGEKFGKASEQAYKGTLEDIAAAQRAIGVEPGKTSTNIGELGAQTAATWNVGLANLLKAGKVSSLGAKAWQTALGFGKMGATQEAMSSGEVTPLGVGLSVGLGAGIPVVGKLGGYLLKEGLSKASGLAPETIMTFFKKPEVISMIDKLGVNFESKIDDIKNLQAGYKAEKAGIGSAYEGIKDVPVNLNNLTKYTETALGDIPVVNGKLKFGPTTSYNLPQQKAISNAYELVNNVANQGNITVKEAMNVRQRLDDLINWEGKSLKASTVDKQAESTIKNIRGAFDEFVGVQVPELKAIDNQFSSKINDIKEVTKDWFKADGSLQENAYSKIQNLFSPTNKMKLDRLEKHIPGISEELRGLTALKDVELAMGNKIGTYGRAAIGLTAGGVVGNQSGQGVTASSLIGLTIAALTNPKVLKGLLMKSGTAANKIAPIINKVKSGIGLTPEENKIVSKVAQENFDVNALKNNMLQAEAFKGPMKKTTTSNVINTPVNKKYMMGGDVKGLENSIPTGFSGIKNTKSKNISTNKLESIADGDAEPYILNQKQLRDKIKSGDYDPIIVEKLSNGNYNVIDGTHRLATARDMGIKDVKIIEYPQSIRKDIMNKIRDIQSKEKRLPNIGGDVKGIDKGLLEKGFKVEKQPGEDIMIGKSYILKGKEGQVQLSVNEVDGKIILTNIATKDIKDLSIKKSGTGLGTKVMESLREYADNTGKELYIASATPKAKAYYEKLGYLKPTQLKMKNDNGILENIPDSYVYKPNSKGLTNK